VTRGLLRSKEEVAWRSAVGKAFPTEGTGKAVVFMAHI
jgi:hypothetical protein